MDRAENQQSSRTLRVPLVCDQGLCVRHTENDLDRQRLVMALVLD